MARNRTWMLHLNLDVWNSVWLTLESQRDRADFSIGMTKGMNGSRISETKSDAMIDGYELGTAMREETEQYRASRKAIGSLGGNPKLNHVVNHVDKIEGNHVDNAIQYLLTTESTSPSAPSPEVAVPKKASRKRDTAFSIAALDMDTEMAIAFERCWQGWPTLGYNFTAKADQPRRINRALAAERFVAICQNMVYEANGKKLGPSDVADATLAWVGRRREETFKQYGNTIAPVVPCIGNYFSAVAGSKKHWQEALVEYFEA